MTWGGWRSPGAGTLFGCAVVVLVFAYKAWTHRWLCDDGLIVFRVVEQIHAGNGPVFNALERTEAATSTLWTWLLAGTWTIYPGSVDHLAVNLGWVFSIVAIVLGLDASRRMLRATHAGILLPAGALLPLGCYAFWDFSTSGLETGMTWMWCALAWWCLVTLETTSSTRRRFATAFLVGLGPLVRPDYALVSAVFLVAGWLLVRPSRKQTVALAAAAIALPLAYQIFRMGYYGIVVPLPALAKSATGSEWTRGLHYAWDFVRACFVYLPLGGLLATFVFALVRRKLSTRDHILVCAPVIAGLLIAVYVTRVGGDFMHARMLLAPTLLVALPAFLLPARKLALAPIIAIGAWAAIVGPYRDDGMPHSGNGYATVWDERHATMGHLGHPNPLNRALFVRGLRPVAGWVAMAIVEDRDLLMTEGGVPFPLRSTGPVRWAFIVGRLGAGGATMPLSGHVVDMLGLANPIGARIPATNRDQAGHEKPLPMYWAIAPFADLSGAVPHISDDENVEARAAARAIQCGDLAELLASVREPMSWSRFWSNFAGSIRRTRLDVPLTGVEAEKRFCR